MMKVENINLQTSPAGCFTKDTSSSKDVLAEDREGPGGRGRVRGCSLSLLFPAEEETDKETDS